MSIIERIAASLPRRRPSLRATSRARVRPFMERLEARMVLSTHTWTGAGADALWSTEDN